MHKKNLLYFTFFFFIGCDSTNTSTYDSTALATVPHANSSIPMLGILINYNNQQISSNETTWSNKLFGKNMHQLNHYYLEVSAMNFEFSKVSENYGISDDSIISVYLDKDHPNSSDLSLTYSDLNAALIVADDYINFLEYDTNLDGKITPDELILTFIIAGFEDAYEGFHVTNGVWAHQYCMTSNSYSPTLDGVSLMGCQNGGNFALFGERHDQSHPHDATIGIIAHELGHATFDLPDLYNTANPNSGGIGYFGLMGSGTWGMQSSDAFAGNTPVHFTAWSKIYNGWITSSIQTGATTLNESSSSNYNVVKIPINSTSYYLLENRNNSGYDRGLYSLTGSFDGGMALWKIDTTKLTAQHFDDNSVNADTQSKGVDLVEAQASNIDSIGGGGDENALYYEGNKNFFSTLITNISQRGSSMSLNIN